MVYSDRYPSLIEQYGEPWYFSHRVDLHDELKRLALGMGSAPHGAKLRLGSGIVKINGQKGTLELATGETYVKDVIIAADGVHV